MQPLSTLHSRLRLEDIQKTIRLVRPDILELLDNDEERFLWWLRLNAPREYKALRELPTDVPDDMLTEAAPEALPHLQPSLTRFMKMVWNMRPDVQALFELHTESGQWGFIGWYFIRGVPEMQLNRYVTDAQRQVLNETAGGFSADKAGVITRLLRIVWQQRPDLHSRFNLSTSDGCADFLWWFHLYGCGEMQLGCYLTPERIAWLNAPTTENVFAGGFMPLTRLMVALWQRRPDLQQAFNLKQKEGLNGFLSWYFIHGVMEHHLIDLVDDAQAGLLLTLHPPPLSLPYIIFLIWKADAELRQHFQKPDREILQNWADGEGKERYPILQHIKRISARAPAEMPVGYKKSPEKPFGVNLIGYARGQLGLGEEVRMAALAMKAAGVPYTIFNIDPGSNVCQADNSAASDISKTHPYAVNMFCTTGFETARLAALDGSRFFYDCLNIGSWPWELAQWPQDWRHAYHLVDEIWAFSRFTYEAYVKSSPVPVRHLPSAVTVDATADRTRFDFNLPADQFLFVFSFDFLSSLARKNPQACVQAFRTAFKHPNRSVGLVVKAMRASPENTLWQNLMAEAEADGRIIVISETLNRAELLDLYRACDCFVSLHRSEGFGRGIAEAMMLGKPVITTGYSGNMDFTVPATAALVNHHFCKVKKGEYPFGDGQEWAEPDPNHAAWWMRRLVNEAELAKRLAQAGQRLAAATFAPALVGANYAAALKDIWINYGKNHAF